MKGFDCKFFTNTAEGDRLANVLVSHESGIRFSCIIVRTRSTGLPGVLWPKGSGGYLAVSTENPCANERWKDWILDEFEEWRKAR